MVINTGVSRKLDELGRIVIPKECRNVLNIYEKDPLEISTVEFKGSQVIVLKKHQPGCVFCGTMDDCVVFKDKYVCKDCISQATLFK